MPNKYKTEFTSDDNKESPQLCLKTSRVQTFRYLRIAIFSFGVKLIRFVCALWGFVRRKAGYFQKSITIYTMPTKIGANYMENQLGAKNKKKLVFIWLCSGASGCFAFATLVF